MVVFRSDKLTITFTFHFKDLLFVAIGPAGIDKRAIN